MNLIKILNSFLQYAQLFINRIIKLINQFLKKCVKIIVLIFHSGYGNRAPFLFFFCYYYYYLLLMPFGMRCDAPSGWKKDNISSGSWSV